MNNSNVAKSKNEIHDLVSSIEARLSIYAGYIEDLRVRIETILTDSSPVSNPTPDFPPPETKLGDRLQTLCAEFDALNFKLESIIERVRL